MWNMIWNGLNPERIETLKKNLQWFVTRQKISLFNYSFDIIYCVLIVSCWVPSTLHYIQHLTCLRPTIKYELSIIVIYIWNICFSWTQRALCKTLAWIMRFKTSKTTFHNLFSSCVTMIWTRTVINTLQRKWLIV